MLTIKFWIMTSLFFLNTTKSNPTMEGGSALGSAEAEPSLCTTLTITRVKKPWYAWRGLVVGKMKKSIPEYQVIPGLHEKLYAFSADLQYFGGIYQWKNRKEAEQWFNQKWFERTEQKYGKRGEVQYFSISSSKTVSKIPKNSSHFWAVLSSSPISAQAFIPGASGLLQFIELKDEQGKTCCLSLWSNKKEALQLEGKFQKNEYFDTPIRLLNHDESR